MWDESDDDDDDDNGMMSSYRATRKYKKAKTLQNLAANFGGAAKTYAQSLPPKPKSAPLPTNLPTSRPLSAAAATFTPAAHLTSSSPSSTITAATPSNVSDAPSQVPKPAHPPARHTRNLYILSALAGLFVGPRGAHLRELEARTGARIRVSPRKPADALPNAVKKVVVSGALGEVDLARMRIFNFSDSHSCHPSEAFMAANK